MRSVKTQKFNGVKYKIHFVDRIDGVTERPEAEDNKPPNLTILNGSDYKALHSALHEALEASGFCDKCLHTPDGNCRTWDAARLLRRLGYQIKNKTRK